MNFFLSTRYSINTILSRNFKLLQIDLGKYCQFNQLLRNKNKNKAEVKTKKRKSKLVKSSRKKIKTKKKVVTKKFATKKRSKKSRKNNKLKSTKNKRGVKKMSTETIKSASSPLLDTSHLKVPFPYKAKYGNYINGKFVEPKSGKYFDNVTPINNEVICKLPRCLSV